MWNTTVEADRPQTDNIHITAHVICVLHTYSYGHAVRICNSYGFFMTMVTRTRLGATSHVHCLSCLFLAFSGSSAICLPCYVIDAAFSGATYVLSTV